MLNRFAIALLYGSPVLALAGLVVGLVSRSWPWLAVTAGAALIPILILTEITRRGERLRLEVTWIRRGPVVPVTAYSLCAVATANGKRYTLCARRDGAPERTEIVCVQATRRLLIELRPPRNGAGG